MLFDILRKLNDEITMFLNEGMPGKTVPLLIATTDGYNATIHFCDRVVWESHKWMTADYPDNMSDGEKELRELELIEADIKAKVMDYLSRLYNIQW